MIINHNLIALNAERQYKAVTNKKAKNTEKLSSGYRINRAADDAAGLSISEKMRHQIRGLTQGIENMQDGISYCKVADGALHELHGMLQRANELAVQAANDTNSESERLYIDEEIQALKEEMKRICDTTKFNEEYIFKCDDNETERTKGPYSLKFSGYPDDLYIYNETYNNTTHTATYGGIAYQGKRYSWPSIDPNMYDSATNTFHAGTYTLTGPDGTNLTLVCEEGSQPPQVSREFQATANSSGIYVNNERISWNQVKDAKGNPITEDTITNKPYSFPYHGVMISFIPDSADNFMDAISRISGTKWKSTYKLPTEEQALYADFSKSINFFKDNDEVKDYLADKPDFVKDPYILHASNGENGTFDGVWLEVNGTEVANSKKTWAELGIKNWGNQSTDIWSNKTYTYTCQPDADNTLTFSFQVVNEISKDSAIDALDGVELPGKKLSEQSPILDNHAELTLDSQTYNNVLGGKISKDTLNLTLEEEYGLGRDYTNIRDTFGKNIQLEYDKNTNCISATYRNTRDNIETVKTYTNTHIGTGSIISQIKKQINTDVSSYLAVIKARYLAGANNPHETNLADLVGPNSITGDGTSTYLKDVITIDPNNPNLNSTLNPSKETSYAGANIDFSGLGTNYQLADLIGMGFNSTCQTCNNHYSIQFTTPFITHTNWSTENTTGCQYSYQQDGQNHTLYIDIDSMKGTITDGIGFTNALVDIIKDAKYDFHFTQYATNSTDAKLYVFDNRPSYVSNNVSTATDASFSPYAYGFNSVAEFNINLFDSSDSSEYISLSYEYDYKDLFAPDKLKINYVEDANGDYVQDANGNYEKYDPTIHTNPSIKRYHIENVTLDIPPDISLDEYLDTYIKDTILTETTKASTLDLISEYAKYQLNGDLADNKALITGYNTPYQLGLEGGNGQSNLAGFKIQCSSNTKDTIYIERQNLSVYRMGLKNLNVLTENQATKAISLVDEALVKVSKIRSKFGTYQNRLEHSIANASNVAENTTASESRIRDTNMAKTMQVFSVQNILLQAGEAIMAQANISNQGVLTLLNS